MCDSVNAVCSDSSLVCRCCFLSFFETIRSRSVCFFFRSGFLLSLLLPLSPLLLFLLLLSFLYFVTFHIVVHAYIYIESVSHYLLNRDSLKASAVLITSTYACNSKRLAVTFKL